MAVPRVWQLQDAKNRLSRVVDEAQRGGPQIITRRGRETAVVLSFQEYRRLVASGSRLVDVLRSAPKVTGGLVGERSKDPGRTVEL